MSQTKDESGKKAKELLDLSVKVGALKFGEFTLASGAKSSYYFDGRRLRLDPQGAHLLGAIFPDYLCPLGVR